MGTDPETRRLHLRTRILIALVAFLLAGCASGTPKMSSLNQELQVTPLRQQDESRARLDDAECERWTRATKGKDEPLPSADLRYAACAVARGYQVAIGFATISSGTDRTLDTVLTEWRECRADKVELSAESYLVPFKGYIDSYKRSQALECLTSRGYTVAESREMAVDSPGRRPCNNPIPSSCPP